VDCAEDAFNGVGMRFMANITLTLERFSRWFCERERDREEGLTQHSRRLAQRVQFCYCWFERPHNSHRRRGRSHHTEIK